MTQAAVLDGLKVLDLTRDLAGGVATMILADQGADVVRLDGPDGDDVYPHGDGAAVWHRGKLRGPADEQQAWKLAAAADVIMVTPDAEGAMPFDVQAVHQVNPRAVIARITGYGPWVQDGGHAVRDILAQARTGLMDEQQGLRDGPVFHDFPLPSYGAAYLAVLGVSSALLARERTGRGQVVDTSLHQGMLMFMNLFWGKAERPSFLFSLGLPKSSTSWIYRTRDDGFIHIHPAAKGAFDRIQELLGIETQPGESLFAGPAFEERHRQWQEAFLRRDRAEWLELLWENDVPAQPVLEPGAAFADEQVAAIGMVIDVLHAERGTLRQVGRAQRFDLTPGRDPRSVSRPGGDADAVVALAENGWRR